MKFNKNSGFGAAVIIVIVAVLAVGGVIFWRLSAKKDTSKNKTSSNTSTSTQSTSQSTTTSSKTASQDLTFSGAFSGNMTTGKAGDTFACGVTATGPIVGTVNGHEYSFEFTNLSASGPGSYKAYVQIGLLPAKETYWGASGTNLVINADRRSGTVDGTLHNLKNDSETLKISGSWSCPAD